MYSCAKAAWLVVDVVGVRARSSVHVVCPRMEIEVCKDIANPVAVAL